MIKNKPNKDELYEMYVLEEKSSRQIAEILGISYGSILRFLKEYDIKARPNQFQKGYTMPQETRDKISKAKTGKTCKKRIEEGNIKYIDGYVFVYDPSNPSSNKDGYIREHRKIMESKIGRQLTQNEVVHHINGIKTDNRIENLELLTISEHSRKHIVERYKNNEGPVAIGGQSKPIVV